uniref:Condensin-2 complex subunit H2 n=1 Tax=Lepeophtheirus salmonis TaxID=72036 RepID=A0A0K2VBG1_LEPSM
MTSSSQQVEDPRFAELIRPIKDLTANFNIPLSQFLDMYYSDLRDGISGLSSTPMDSQSKVNFAQAGLLIQGTVSVYSRKVEFLWQNVLKMLEFLAQRQSVQDEMEMGDCPSNTEEVGGSSKRKNKLLKKDSLLFHGDFLPLPCNFSPHTLMKDSSLQNNHINFIAITPCQLIQKEGKETAPHHTRVNIYSKSTNETLGPKDDFRVNSQYCSVTGVIGQGIVGPTNLPDLSISLCVEKNNDDLPSSPPLLEEINEVHHFEGEFHSEEPDCIEPIEEDLPISEVHNNTDSLRRSKRQILKDSIVEERDEKLSLTQIWAPLNPHEVSNQEKNVSKKRRTTLLSRRPKLAPEKSTASLSKKTLSEYYNNIKCATHRPKREAIANIPPELTREAFEEEKRRKSMKKKLKITEQCPEGQDDCDNQETDNSPDENDGDAAQDWNEGDAPDPHEHFPLLQTPSSPSLVNEIRGQNSYEELVVKRVATYVAQSQNYIESTDLAKRVSSWHEHIRPKLEAVESRGSFNIHSYGTKVIESFPNDDRKTSISFGSLVNDVETEEISRYFLSCLMLANTSNLELESNGMNNLFLTLLTKKRHHEELMASQEEPVLTKSSSRKRVMLNPSNTTVSESIHQEIMDELNELPDQGLSQKEVFVIPRPVKLNKHVYQ